MCDGQSVAGWRNRARLSHSADGTPRATQQCEGLACAAWPPRLHPLQLGSITVIGVGERDAQKDSAFAGDDDKDAARLLALLNHGLTSLQLLLRASLGDAHQQPAIFVHEHGNALEETDILLEQDALPAESCAWVGDPLWCVIAHLVETHHVIAAMSCSCSSISSQ